MTQGITGLMFGDKGYISTELFLKLYQRGLKLVIGIRKNMLMVRIKKYSYANAP